MIACQLCNADPRLVWNNPLIESPNFLVLPSLGSLVEGWLLILPKKHVLSFGALPVALISEMEEVKAEVTARIQGLYGDVSLFEHGPSEKGKSVGCGVDHAHLHVVPTDFDLAHAISPHLPTNTCWSKADLSTCQKAARDGNDYLYFEQPIGRGRIICDKRLGSQLFRRAFADHLGVPENYNWRNNSEVVNITKTIAALTEDLRREKDATQVFANEV